MSEIELPPLDPDHLEALATTIARVLVENALRQISSVHPGGNEGDEVARSAA